VLEGAECLHLSALEAAAAENSVVSTQCFSLGGACVRNEAVVHLRGGGANALLAGLSLINKEQHVDNHTVIEHAVAHCASRELYKGIYAEQAQGVFDGTIVVRPQAQKTNAFQSSQSLLLSREACVNSKPQLKIWADDVKCTHGATAGQLDDDALFYLRSRGIEKNEARRILMQAFAGDVVKEVKNDAVRTMIEALVEKRLVELPVDFA
ncbi:MAG TPA: SufD family Fe-S cluster assembly protein, partial [Oligoflexia bacterium]|nr:SufD family Fe-S cluster assembly protein [Oligoflexia bacterium]